jgi:hypothetical protein
MNQLTPDSGVVTNWVRMKEMMMNRFASKASSAG